jgi:hypothetical protein
LHIERRNYERNQTRKPLLYLPQPGQLGAGKGEGVMKHGRPGELSYSELKRINQGLKKQIADLQKKLQDKESEANTYKVELNKMREMGRTY